MLLLISTVVRITQNNIDDIFRCGVFVVLESTQNIYIRVVYALQNGTET